MMSSFVILNRYRSLNVGARRGLLPHFPLGDSIPRIIHQTYKNTSFPDGINENIQRMQDLNPGWEHRFYDNDAALNFIKAEYGPTILDYYLRIAPEYGAARADLFRYLLIYRLGGVYLDLKSSVSRPFDTVLEPDDKLLLSFWPQNDARFEGWGIYSELPENGGREFQQWHIIAAPGHPFLREVIEWVFYNIDHYIPEWHGTGAYANLRVTAPVPYTLAINSVFNTAPKRVFESHEDIGLVYSIYDDPLTHRGLMGQHYTKLTSPMVRTQTPQRQISMAIRLLQAARRRML